MTFYFLKINQILIITLLEDNNPAERKEYIKKNEQQKQETPNVRKFSKKLKLHIYNTLTFP